MLNKSLPALLTTASVLSDSSASYADGPKPLKVFILAGRSNMEGHTTVETFDYLGDDPATVPLLKQMRDADGKPRVCDHVWISYFTGGETDGEELGKLTAGYGSRRNPAEPGGRIGPEFTFGLTLDAALDEPVLLIRRRGAENRSTTISDRRRLRKPCFGCGNNRPELSTIRPR